MTSRKDTVHDSKGAKQMNTLNKYSGRTIILDTKKIDEIAHRERAKATQELIQSFKSLFRSKSYRQPLDVENKHSNICNG